MAAKKTGSAAARKTSSKTSSKTTSKTTAAKKAAKVATKTARKTTTKSAATTRKSATKSPSASPSAQEQLTEYRRKRDFTRTAEPSGEKSSSSSAGSLRFVIQKHDATQLHYDLRLEIDGVMKSWAVPKGPSADPTIRRLAMQVEDHPVDYNTFEGTIPKGEYGGGTVMLWDNGTYSVENPTSDDVNTAAREAYERGDFKVNFHGHRIKGSYAIVRTKGFRGSSSSKPSWLLIKHRDGTEVPERDEVLTEKYTTSVTTKRSMDKIAKDNDRVWT